MAHADQPITITEFLKPERIYFACPVLVSLIRLGPTMSYPTDVTGALNPEHLGLDIVLGERLTQTWRALRFGHRVS